MRKMRFTSNYTILLAALWEFIPYFGASRGKREWESAVAVRTFFDAVTTLACRGREEKIIKAIAALARRRTHAAEAAPDLIQLLKQDILQNDAIVLHLHAALLASDKSRSIKSSIIR